MVICLYYSLLPVKNTFMYLAIMCQPVEDGSYKASFSDRAERCGGCVISVLVVSAIALSGVEDV